MLNKERVNKIMNEIDEKTIELAAYRLIRIETRRFDRESTDAELGNYVKGVVDLQTEIYSLLTEKGK